MCSIVIVLVCGMIGVSTSAIGSSGGVLLPLRRNWLVLVRCGDGEAVNGGG